VGITIMLVCLLRGGVGFDAVSEKRG
jgi:hypothetical protein